VSFINWLENHWLIKHKPNAHEIASMIKTIKRDLEICVISQVGTDWRFNITFNAALLSASIALAASGYRAGRGEHHYRIIESLALTIGADAAFIERFHSFRKKRSIATYSQAGCVSEQELSEMIALEEYLRKRVMDWMQKEHPELLSKIK
jgi:hypothetical protein